MTSHRNLPDPHRSSGPHRKEALMVDKEDLRTTIADTLDVDVEALTDDANFMDDLGIDSLMALEVMVVLERKYKIKLQESQLKDITCLNSAYALLTAELAGAS